MICFFIYVIQLCIVLPALAVLLGTACDRPLLCLPARLSFRPQCQPPPLGHRPATSLRGSTNAPPSVPCFLPSPMSPVTSRWTTSTSLPRTRERPAAAAGGRGAAPSSANVGVTRPRRRPYRSHDARPAGGARRCAPPKVADGPPELTCVADLRLRPLDLHRPKQAKRGRGRSFAGGIDEIPASEQVVWETARARPLELHSALRTGRGALPRHVVVHLPNL